MDERLADGGLKFERAEMQMIKRMWMCVVRLKCRRTSEEMKTVKTCAITPFSKMVG